MLNARFVRASAERLLNHHVSGWVTDMLGVGRLPTCTLCTWWAVQLPLIRRSVPSANIAPEQLFAQSRGSRIGRGSFTDYSW